MLHALRTMSLALLMATGYTGTTTQTAKTGIQTSIQVQSPVASHARPPPIALYTLNLLEVPAIISHSNLANVTVAKPTVTRYCLITQSPLIRVTWLAMVTVVKSGKTSGLDVTIDSLLVTVKLARCMSITHVMINLILTIRVSERWRPVGRNQLPTHCFCML